jgi:sec-independent protein translocase protein TatA
MFRNPTTDLIVVLVIVLLIFGPKRLPGLGKQLGTGLKEFKDSITGDSKDDEEDKRPEIASASAAPVAAPSEHATADSTPAQPVGESAERGS